MRARNSTLITSTLRESFHQVQSLLWFFSTYEEEKCVHTNIKAEINT
jgi:hypothetical protein